MTMRRPKRRQMRGTRTTNSQKEKGKMLRSSRRLKRREADLRSERDF